MAGWELRREPVVDSGGKNYNGVCEGQTECAITDRGCWSYRCVSVFVCVCEVCDYRIPDLPSVMCQSKLCDDTAVRLVIY